MTEESWPIGPGGGVGAAPRHLVDRTVSGVTAGRLPWGTLTVDTVDALLLGLLAGTASAVAAEPRLRADRPGGGTDGPRVHP